MLLPRLHPIESCFYFVREGAFLIFSVQVIVHFRVLIVQLMHAGVLVILI